ncbi:MAG: hypothetical protein AAB618_02860 [Patescibacteria group bacterium]
MRFSTWNIFIIFVVLLSFTQVSFAQDASSTASSNESGGFFESVLENIGGIKDSVAEAVPASQSVLTVVTEKRLTNLAANISNRLDGLSARLRQISSRLEVRINKQAEAGYNVDAARASLATANEFLAAAANDLKNIDLDVYRAFRSLTPKEDWREVRATYIKARDNIRMAHTELKNTVNALKLATPVAAVATSTATSTQ